MTTFQYLCLRLGLLLDRLPKRRKPKPAKPELITGALYVTPGIDTAVLAKQIAEHVSGVQPRAGRAY